MYIIGIDLGTTNSLAAVWRSGKSELIPNAAGEYLTPSVVSVDNDGSILIGKAAHERAVTHPHLMAGCFKRDMGTGKRYRLGGHSFLPEELSALVLRRLREDAEAYLGEAVTEAVISVPAYFAEAQRAATKHAGELAGLKVERLVNEPSAAAVSGHLGEGSEDKVSLIFDFGGGTLDVSLVERFENVVSVTAVSGDNRLGGRDFDLAIAQGFCKECGLKYEKLSREVQEMLLLQSERCKIALTTQEVVLMVMSAPELSATLPLTNEWLIRAGSELFHRLNTPIQRVLMDAELSPSGVDELIMVGGSSHMPSVRRYVSRILGKGCAPSAHPDTAVALGAGICAGMKSRVADLRDLVLTDVCPFTLGTSIYNYNEPDNALMSPIIERNCVLPSSKEGRYVTVRNMQPIITAGVYQGENLYCKDNVKLGEIKLEIPPAPAGEQGALLRFTYDINGLLEVEATKDDGEKVRVVLHTGSGMTEEEAERRLKDLQTLKLHPRAREENRILLARGERLFAMTVGPVREQVHMMLTWFQGQLEKQEPFRIAKAGKKLDSFFDRIEAYLGVGDLPTVELERLFDDEDDQ